MTARGAGRLWALAALLHGCVAGGGMGDRREAPDEHVDESMTDGGLVPDLPDDALDGGSDARVRDTGAEQGDVDAALDAGSGDAAPADPCAALGCPEHAGCEVGATGPQCVCDDGFSGAACDVITADYPKRFKVAEGLADPDVVQLGERRFVLSGTSNGNLLDLYESSDLVQWTKTGSYDPSSADASHDYCFVWAPDLVRIDDTLYLYFSAHRGNNGATSCPPPAGSDVTTYRAAAAGSSLTFGAPEPLFEGQSGAQSRMQSGCPAGGCPLAIRIDAAVYGGRLYYVYFDSGNNIASVALDNPASLLLHTGPAEWALNSYEENINEGPELLERDGHAYLFFSGASFDSQYATFYFRAGSLAQLTRAQPLNRLTTPVRRGDGTLAETHGHNSIVTLHGESFNFFHVGVFNAGGGLVRRDTYRQRIVWKSDGSAVSQNQVVVSWNALGGSYTYSLDLVLHDGGVIGPCIAVNRIGSSTSTTFTGICPDALDRLVHKSEVQAFRLFASSGGGAFMQVGETSFDGWSDTVQIAAAP